MLSCLPEPCHRNRRYDSFAIPHLREPWKPAAAMDVKMRRRSMGPGRSERPPRSHPRVNPNRKSTSALPAMDRGSMLVMEANEIASCLGKDYMFSKVANLDVNEENTEIKITHQKWKISCIWSLDKLKGRLVRMRKLIYASDSDSMECEAVFFDPSDTWTRDETGRALSPQHSVPLEHSSAMLPVNGVSTGSSSINGSSPKKGENLWIASIPTEQESRSPPKPRAVKRPPKLSLIKPPPGRKSPGFTKSDRSKSSDDEDYHIVHSPQKAVAGHSRLNGIEDKMSCHMAGNLESGHGDMLDYVPQKDTNSPMRMDTMRSTSSGSELPGESLFLLEADPTTTADLRAMLPEKYLADSTSSRGTPTHRHAMTSPSPARRHVTSACQTDPPPPSIPALAVCKGFLTATRDRLKSATTPPNMEYVDKILANCEAVKVAVLNVFEGFTQAQETSEEADSFAESTLIKASSLQMAAGMELLSSNCDLWTSSLEELEPSLAAELKHNLSEALFNMADDLVVFLESCESGDEGDVAESAGRLVDRVHALCREAGQVALAVGSQSVLLDDPEPSSISDLLSFDNNDDDCFSCKAGQDLQQALLDGSDRYLGRAFRCAQSTLEECLASPPPPATDNNALSLIWQSSETAVANCLILLQQCKKLQEELNAQMRTDSDKAPHYFRFYQIRSHDVNSHIQHLANCCALLCQAKAGLETDSDGGCLRKIYRCAEILQRSANKVVTVVSCTPPEVNDSEAGSSSSRQSLETCLMKSIVLSDRQYQRVQRHGCDLKTSLDKLLNVVKDKIVLESTSGPVKTRRMLPATPGGKSVVRCQSARCPDRKRGSRPLSLIHFGRSNEA